MTQTTYEQMAGRQASRALVGEGARYIAKKAASTAVSKGVGALAKGAANPAFIAGDALEIGIERVTGSRDAGRAASAAFYIGAGAAAGGPVGAVAGAAMWAAGQLLDGIFG